MSKLPKSIITGRVGEQYSRVVQLDVSEEMEQFPGTGPVLLYRRPGEDTLYPGTITFNPDTNIIEWVIDGAVTAVAGADGAVQIMFSRNDNSMTIIGRSFIIRLSVLESLTNPDSEPPDAYETWLENLTTLAAQTQGNAASAQQSASSASASATAASGYAASAQQAVADAQSVVQDISVDYEALDQAVSSAASSADLASGSADAASASAGSASSAAISAMNGAAQASLSATAARDAADEAADTITEIRQKAEAAAASASDADSSAEAALKARDQFFNSTARCTVNDRGYVAVDLIEEDDHKVFLFELSRGPQGNPGHGVPSGGNENEVLRKASGTDYDTEWHALDDSDIPSSAVSGQTTVEGALGSLSQQKADKETTYTKTEVDSLVQSVFRYKGTKATVAEVEALTQKAVGDMWFVTADSSEYAWNGTVWEKLGPIIDLTPYLLNISIAGLTINAQSTTITKEQLLTALRVYTKAEVDTMKEEVDEHLENVDSAISTDTETVTGNPVTVETESAQVAEKTVIHLEPIQEGSGDPSPDNVRPITGWTGANVYVSPTTDAEDGQTYAITFPTEAGTVYGGTLTVNKDGTGTLVVDTYKFNMTQIRYFIAIWEDGKSINFYHPSGVNPNSFDYQESKLKSNRYKSSNFSTILDNRIYFFNLSGLTIRSSEVIGTTNEEIISYFAEHDTEVCYKLDTPSTYHLLAEQVKLLKGTNHVSTDGTSLELTARKGVFATLDDIADEYERTNDKLEELSQQIGDMISDSDQIIATKIHAVGDVFICGDKLYKATDSIASGERLIEGSNVTKTTIIAVIAEQIQSAMNQ